MAIKLEELKERKVNSEYYINLMEKIEHKTAVIGVIGIGYVGLPNIVSKAKKGYSVIGFDVSKEKVESINNGISYIGDVDSDTLHELVVQKRKIFATTDFNFLSQADVIIVCVPTPIDDHKNPDMTYVHKATIEIAKHSKKGALAILESTTYPTTTEKYLVEYMEARGLTVGEDYFVAYAPERIDPSNKDFNIDNTSRVVGGHTDRCTSLAAKLIGGFVKEVTSTKVAEMAKVFENTFRFVNIALSNELSLICDKMGIDVWEVIDASATKPYGFMPFYPTVGVGGHCIPVDPYYLSWYSKKYNMVSRMIELAGDINDKMSDYTINKILRILNNKHIVMNSSNIAILGASYKKDIDDVRESSIFKLYESLKHMGANITIYDDYVNSIYSDGDQIEVKDVEYNKLRQFDLVIILTDHSTFDYKKIAENSLVILDTRNAMKDHVKHIQCDYYKI